MKIFAAETGISLPDYEDTDFIFKGKATLGEVISKLLPYIYLIAGLSLFLMLIWGGITLMTAAGNPDQSKAGYGRITGALLGFVIVFISYFIVQLVEIILGVKIL
jgi:hypothetical protein